MEKQTRKTTLKDVARMCDVSPMTVSKMLNGKGGVSKDTAKRIWKAIRELNYTPNLVAKSLRINQTRTFGVVTSDSSELLFPKMIKGIVDAAAAAEYSVIIANTNKSQERENESIKVLLNKRIDGLLLAAPYRVDADLVSEINGFGIPMVLLMRASQLAVDFVTSDNFNGAYAMMRFLLEQGADDFYFFCLPTEHQNSVERFNGWRQALRENGVAVSEERIYRIPGEIEAGYAHMRAMLTDGVRRGTFVCGCDALAVGAMRAVLEAGLRIPDDMRFCGFDDIELLDYLHVPLTTMRQQVYEMGREGVRLLLKRIDDRGAPTAQMRLPCQLVVRKSV